MSTQTKHTPGPWIVTGSRKKSNFDEWVRIEVCAKGPKTVCEFHADPEKPEDCAEMAANARLIAAAPELLDIVKDLADRDTFYLGEKLAAKVYAALAKAEGRAYSVTRLV